MSFPLPGILHEYAPKLTAFEIGTLKSKNVVLFIAGLGDSLLTVPYVAPMAAELEKIGWTTIQIFFTSSHIGWGTGSLERDFSEITKLINYLKTDVGGNREKIVLMGHSTGCQNTLHYLSKSGLADTIDGGVLQAGISDREAMIHCFQSEELVDESVALAKKLIDQGEPDTLMPVATTKIFLPAPVNAYRWYSLGAKRADDEYFGSYLTAEDHKETFGKVAKPLLIAFSANDEYVPDYVDRVKLVDDWKKAVDPAYLSKYSGAIPGATHNCGTGSTEESIPALIAMVKGFLEEKF